MINALIASSLAVAGGDIVPVEPVVEANPWKNEVTIYGWLPLISATTPLPDSGEVWMQRISSMT